MKALESAVIAATNCDGLGKLAPHMQRPCGHGNVEAMVS